MTSLPRVSRRVLAALLVLPLLLLPAVAQDAVAHRQMKALVDSHAQHWGEVSRRVWEFAEVGYKEKQSSALLEAELQQAGFKIQAGVAEQPTAFIATYGSGKPVIAILGEYDALPGLSQASVPERQPVTVSAPGHGCGHNLLGAGAALAAVAIKDYMQKNHLPGTLRYYGTPAEEGGSGKVYMARAGLFGDVDTVLHWHPSDENSVTNGGALAIISGKFKFTGIAAHASAAPDKGRSALDGVMLMGMAVEMLREHVPSTTRMHYVITKGGGAPNVVPEVAELFLYARAPEMTVLDPIWERIIKAGNGAALATETKMALEIVSSDYELLPNDVLAQRIHQNLTEVGGVKYSPAQQDFATTITKTFAPGTKPKADGEKNIEPLKPSETTEGQGSTDVGDVSWSAPTIGISTATWVPGTSAHTWQAASASGMEIGRDGMRNAAQVLALTALDLFSDPALVSAARAEFVKRQDGQTYRSRIPADHKPPLNYRD